MVLNSGRGVLSRLGNGRKKPREAVRDFFESLMERATRFLLIEITSDFDHDRPNAHGATQVLQGDVGAGKRCVLGHPTRVIAERFERGRSQTFGSVVGISAYTDARTLGRWIPLIRQGSFGKGMEIDDHRVSVIGQRLIHELGESCGVGMEPLIEEALVANWVVVPQRAEIRCDVVDGPHPDRRHWFTLTHKPFGIDHET